MKTYENIDEVEDSWVESFRKLSEKQGWSLESYAPDALTHDIKYMVLRYSKGSGICIGSFATKLFSAGVLKQGESFADAKTKIFDWIKENE